MNIQLPQAVTRAARKFESRPQAEKLIVLMLLLAGMGMGYLTFVSDPMTASREAAERDIATTTRQIQAQQTAYTQKVEQSQEDPNRFANERLSAINLEQQQLDTEISNLAGELVTPANMTRILTAALQRQDGLELVQIQNSGAEPLRTGIATPARGSSGADSESVSSGRIRSVSAQVYQHGIALEFRGDYFSTLKYLLLLEQLSDSFYWDSVTFTQSQWPMATVRLQIHTLSTEEGFIGV